MSSTSKNFVEVLEQFKSKGWKLQKNVGKYRVFIKAGYYTVWLIPVENNKVNIEYVKKIEQFFKQEENEIRDSQ